MTEPPQVRDRRPTGRPEHVATASAAAVTPPQPYSPVAVAGLLHRQPGPAVIRRTFVLTKTYTPRVDIPDVVVIDGDHPSVVLGQETLVGGSGHHYRVTGFDFDGNVLLTGGPIGMTYRIGQAVDAGFDLVDVPADPPQPSYVGYTNVSGWKKQIFPKGCWLGVMSVLAGRPQQEIQTSLGWPDDAFFGMVAHQLIEFSQLISCPVVEIDAADVDAIYTSVNAGAPVILGIQDPAHVMLIYAVSTDPGHGMMRIWDPADGSTQDVPTPAVLAKADAVFVRR